MITGTAERTRSALHTSVPLMPGSIRSSRTMSAPLRSNSSRASWPVPAIAVVKPSLRSRKASGSAKDSSSSTISTRVIVSSSSPDAVGQVERPAGRAGRGGVRWPGSGRHVGGARDRGGRLGGGGGGGGPGGGGRAGPGPPRGRGGRGPGGARDGGGRLGGGGDGRVRGGGAGADRQPHGERRAGARAAPQPDLAAVVGQHVLDDRQAQPGAPGGPGAGRVDPEEPLEDPLLVLGGDADAAVGDRDLHPPARAPPG